MNTTYIAQPHSPTYKKIAARALHVGDAFIHGKVDKVVTSITQADEGYITVRFHGGMVMCEANTSVCIRIQDK